MLLKKIILSTFILFVGQTLLAQVKEDSIPTYVRIPQVPPFKLMLAPDSTAFTKDGLKKRRATIIMVFSPDCDHCIKSTEDLIAHYNLFKKAQIIMVSALPFEYVKKFYDKMKIADYPNIKVGEDRNYFLGSFYKVRSFPAIYTYDKKGNFKQFFDGSVKWEIIAKSL